MAKLKDKHLQGLLNQILTTYEPCTAKDKQFSLTTNQIFDQLQETYPGEYTRVDVFELLDSAGFKPALSGDELHFVYHLRYKSE